MQDGGDAGGGEKDEGGGEKKGKEGSGDREVGKIDEGCGDGKKREKDGVGEGVAGGKKDETTLAAAVATNRMKKLNVLLILF